MMDLVKMVSNEGYMEVFWETLKEQRQIDPATTQRSVYEAMEEAYFALYHCNHFRSFDAFKMFRRRLYRTK